MQLLWLLSSAAAVSAAAIDNSRVELEKRSWTPDSVLGTNLLYLAGMAKLGIAYIKNPSPTCKLSNVSKRKEWTTLSTGEKQSYINAVLCLQSKPSQIGSGVAPGAVSRYDDFVAIHIQQTLTIHATGNFLSWHRYFTWAYEQALRNECGYTGYQPYINHGKIASDPLNSPLLDGSATSMSGNGAYHEYSGVSIPSAAVPLITLPPGQGGDCVTSGPFVNMQVNLGPLSPALPFVAANPSPDGLGANPRCLRRDVSTYAAAMALTDKNATDLIKNSPDILTFQNTLQGNFPAGLIGIHTAGHFLVGGDPGGDLFASPGDPYFFLHHAEMDRLWSIWQNQNLATRETALAGTRTLFNSPPSNNTLLTDIIDLGVLADNVAIAEVMSTIKGPLCYVYL